MRYFISNAVPPFERVLLIESGSRQIMEGLLSGLYEAHPALRADLITCFAGTPGQFRSNQGRIYRVSDYPSGESRKRLYAELRANRYDVSGVICSAEPIMTKWKWMLTLLIPAKVFIVNENGDYFWLDRGHRKHLRHFIMFRAGFSGVGAVRTLTRLLLFPFTLVYLIVFAAAFHLRRKLRTL